MNFRYFSHLYIHPIEVKVEQNALRAYLFSVISLGNCYLLRFATLLGETLESAQFPMT